MARADGTFCVSPEHVATLSGESVRTFVAYLILSCGTGGDNTTTKWGVQSVEKYGHMRTENAKEAVERLEELGIVVRDEASSSPRKPVRKMQGHKTQQEGQIWLPRALVEGIEGGAKGYPLRRIRESGDPMLLRLLMDLYAHHDLPAWGGVNPKALCKPQETSEKIDASGGAMKVWGFDTKVETVGHTLYKVHKDSGKVEDFWSRLALLQSFGYLEQVVTLLDGPDGDLLFAFEDGDLIGDRIRDHCEELMFDKNYAYGYMHVLPVPAHIQEPHLIVIYRLKYRPHTKRTAAWFAKMTQASEIYLGQVGLVEGEKLTPIPAPQPAAQAPESRRGFWAGQAPDFD